MDDLDELLLLPEVAAKIKTPEATLRYWRSIGYGPRSFKIGRRVMYRRDDLREWLTHQHSTTSGAGTAA